VINSIEVHFITKYPERLGLNIYTAKGMDKGYEYQTQLCSIFHAALLLIIAYFASLAFQCHIHKWQDKL
jgi:hypothetical protein